ncbi:MAG: DUF2062 domain-containing protein [Alphaproteobacteria bacterium]|nr:DUF2062 domain-containing protein [Alphaproteobacteria bacterium]MCB9692932.1 DUF2062 domain-containing protein [Alphaproteobacteria bacterium]
MFLGIFLGVVPLYGIQTGICLVVAHVLRLNKLTVIAAAQVSMPMFAPFLIGGSIAIGELLRFGTVRWPSAGDGAEALRWTEMFSGGAPDVVISCFLGSLVLGAILGGLGAAAAWAFAVRRSATTPTT